MLISWGGRNLYLTLMLTFIFLVMKFDFFFTNKLNFTFMEIKNDCQTVHISENEDTTSQTVNSDIASLTDQLKLHRLPSIKEATKRYRKYRIKKLLIDDTPRDPSK